MFNYITLAQKGRSQFCLLYLLCYLLTKVTTSLTRSHFDSEKNLPYFKLLLAKEQKKRTSAVHYVIHPVVPSALVP